jgi:hypothetical protein
MHFVSADGVWLEDRGGFCGHSWGIRLAYDGHWGIGCHGDGSPNALRVSVFDRGSAIQDALFGDGTDPTQRALGGLVAVPGGFWLNHIQPGSEMHLSRVDDNANIVYDEVVPEATGLSTNYPFRAYMEAYGTSQLLLGWKSNGQLTLATADLTSGALLEGPVAVNAEIDDYVDFVSYPNGDVVWAFSPGRSSSIDIVRVAACE